MIPVHRLLPEALADILRRAPLSPEKVEFAWRAAVGPALAKVTTVQLREQMLHVRVSDSRWQREVEHSAGLIRARLNALLGTGVIRDIAVSPR